MKVWDVLNFLHHEGLGQDVLGFFEVMMQPLMERIMAKSIHISHYGTTHVQWMQSLSVNQCCVDTLV